MIEVMSDVRSALMPEDDSGVRCIFLAGYLSETNALPCSLEKFTEAGEKFVTDTGLQASLWEVFLATLVRQTFKTISDRESFRRYLGKSVAEYKAATSTAPVEPPPVVEVPFSLALDPADIDFLRRDLVGRTKSMSGIPLGGLVMKWVVVDNYEGSRIEFDVVNADTGPHLIASAYGATTGRILGTSKPTRSMEALHRIELPGKVYVVQLESRGKDAAGK